MENKKNRVSLLLAWLLFLLLCGSTFLNYKLIGYLDECDEQIEKQDSMIRRLTFSNDLIKEFFDIEEDSVNHTTTYTLKEEKRNNVVEHVTKYSEPIFIRDGQEFSSDELVAHINDIDNEALIAIQQLTDKYNTLVHDYNELVKSYRTKSDSVNIQSSALGLIKRNYGIDFVYRENGNIRTVEVRGEKVDSALLLLPYYRNKITYDPNAKAWIVEYERKIKK